MKTPPSSRTGDKEQHGVVVKFDADRGFGFIRDFRFMASISGSFGPGMLKSVRRRASVSIQYSVCESTRSSLP